jgi:hypothetical protein
VAIAVTAIIRPANIMTRERLSMTLPPADASITRRLASRGEWSGMPHYRPGLVEWSWLNRCATVGALPKHTAEREFWEITGQKFDKVDSGKSGGWPRGGGS